MQPQRLTVFPTTQKHRIPADPRPVGSARLSEAEARATSTPGAAGRGHLSIPSRTGSERRKNATTAFIETPVGQKLYPLLPSLGASPNRPATHTRHTRGARETPRAPGFPVRSLRSSTRRRRRTVLVELAHVKKGNQYS